MSSSPATMPAESGDAPRRGAWLREAWRSSVGKKVIIALTGAVLVVYVVLHVLGNLKAFQGNGGSGDPAIDRYADFLRTVGEPVIPRNGVLWAVRLLLIFCLVVHVAGVIQLSRRNRAARPEGFAAPVQQRTLASRTMLAGGLFLLAFIVFHILQFTTGTIEPSKWTSGEVYANLDNAFTSVVFVVIYALAALALGMHLRHAIWSFFQTGGWDKPNRNPTIRRTATFLSTAVAVGFVSVPVAFWTGIVSDPQRSDTTTQTASSAGPSGRASSYEINQAVISVGNGERK
jgi:succinate dehydrogenase / fumarate reductase cytochrome b subunit